MNVLALLVLIFVIPLIALLAWFAVSSCLGDSFRAQVAGTRINPRHGAYGRSYARGLGSNPGAAGSEMIEMEDMMRDKWESDDEP